MLRHKRSALFGVLLILVVVFITWNGSKRNWKGVTGVEKAEQRGMTRKEIRDQLYFDFVDSTKVLDRVFNQTRKKRLPDVIGIGVEKCGTAAFKRLIMGHPLLRTISIPEAHYFNRPNKKLDHYIDLMPEVAPYEIVLEETPGYFHGGTKDLPQKLWELLPTAKVYFILCDPVNRTFSDFVQENQHGDIPKGTFYDVLMTQLLIDIMIPKGNNRRIVDYLFYKRKMNPNTHLLTAGLYFYHISRFLEFYNRSQVFFVNSEDLISRPWDIIDEFQEFLGIPKLLIPEDFVRGPSGFYCVAPPVVKTDVSGQRKVVNLKPTCLSAKGKSRTRFGHWIYTPGQFIVNKVRKFYAPHNKKLFEFLGRSFNWS